VSILLPLLSLSNTQTLSFIVGNVYLTSGAGHTVVKVNSTGWASVIGGSGTAGFSGIVSLSQRILMILQLTGLLSARLIFFVSDEYSAEFVSGHVSQ